MQLANFLVRDSIVEFLAELSPRVFVNGGFQLVARVVSGVQIRLPPFNVDLTPF